MCNGYLVRKNQYDRYRWRGTQVFKDMDQWVEIRRRVLTREISKRAACKQYQIEWRTLQRILKYEEPAGYRLKEPRQQRKLSALLPIIHEILQQDRLAPK